MCILLRVLSIWVIIIISSGDQFSNLKDDDIMCGNSNEVNNNIRCYKDLESDDLPVARDFRENSIYFIQTVCKKGLNYREACSVEAAARAHPNRTVNILFAGPVSSNCLFQEPFLSLSSYRNIGTYRIHVRNYTKKTPLAGLITSKLFSTSSHKPLDAANILKLVTLYKFGGIYLDFDIIVLKSFDKFGQNWIGKMTKTTLGTGVLALSKEGIGKIVSTKASSILRQDFSDDSWTAECSSDVMKVALESICSTPDVAKMSHKSCKGFRFYDPWYFYPIPVKGWKRMFANFTGLRTYNMYAVHTWNHHSAKTKIATYSLMAYLMKTYCPVVYETYNSKNAKRVIRPSK